MICDRSGNNPRSLALLAKMIKNDKEMTGYVTVEDFEEMLHDSDSPEGQTRTEMENVVRRSIRELDFGTKVVLEAISLHPTHFFFDDIMYLLDVEKAHNALLSPPEYDEAAMNQFTERCQCLARMLYHQSRQQLRRVCKDKLKLLMKAATV